MTRLTPHTARGPLKVLKSDHPGDALYVCRCGLTANPAGLCDGSHHATKDEQPGTVYSYQRFEGKLIRIATVPATHAPESAPHAPPTTPVPAPGVQA